MITCSTIIDRLNNCMQCCKTDARMAFIELEALFISIKTRRLDAALEAYGTCDLTIRLIEAMHLALLVDPTQRESSELHDTLLNAKNLVYAIRFDSK